MGRPGVVALFFGQQEGLGAVLYKKTEIFGVKFLHSVIVMVV